MIIKNVHIQPVIGTTRDISGKGKHTLLMEIKSDTDINPEDFKRMYGKHKAISIEIKDDK